MKATGTNIETEKRKDGRKPFYLIACAHEAETDGQMRELKTIAENANVPGIFKRDDLCLLPFRTGKGITNKYACSFDDDVCILEKEDNGDLIRAVRAAINCIDGVIVPFAHNPHRDYYKNGECWTAKQFILAVGELRRISPLFGRYIKVYTGE